MLISVVGQWCMVMSILDLKYYFRMPLVFPHYITFWFSLRVFTTCHLWDGARSLQTFGIFCMAVVLRELLIGLNICCVPRVLCACAKADHTVLLTSSNSSFWKQSFRLSNCCSWKVGNDPGQKSTWFFPNWALSWEGSQVWTVRTWLIPSVHIGSHPAEPLFHVCHFTEVCLPCSVITRLMRAASLQG